MKLSFIWWNTALAPPVINSNYKATDKDLNIVYQMLSEIINKYEADFIALGEVNKELVDEIKRTMPFYDFDIIDLTSNDGKIIFDTCLLVRKNKVSISVPENIIAIKAGKRHKIAQRIELNIANFDNLITIFMSHWNSVRSLDDTKRQYLGEKLYNEVKCIINSPVILMGDYNAEPFNNALAIGLSATRDRERVKTNTELLYNPFWRHLGETKPYKVNTNYPCRSGSYYYKNGHETRWHTFDQMIFSAYFLGKNQWHLNEELTGILEIDGFLNLVKSPKEKFDHFPIISVIEKEVYCG